MAKAYFYTTADDKKVVHKNLSVIATDVNVDLVMPCDRENPTVIVNRERLGNLSTINYMYLSSFDRYYYCDAPQLLNNGMVSITGHVDALKSFESGINAISAVISRQEYVYNDYIEDNLVTPRVERIVEKKVIGSIGNDPSYTITCAGGGSNGNN